MSWLDRLPSWFVEELSVAISIRVMAIAAIYLILAKLAAVLVHHLVPRGPCRTGADLAVFWATYIVAILLLLTGLDG